MEGLKKVVDACHPYGAKVSIQLQQAGPEGSAKAAGFPLKSASPVQASCNKDVPIEMTTEQIYQLVDLYGDAAESAMKAGVDAVEIHMAHGYLISSFLSPQTNKRLDEFGGNFENRMRLPRMIIEKVIEKTGHKIAILCRINSSDELLGGLTLQDSKPMEIAAIVGSRNRKEWDSCFSSMNIDLSPEEIDYLCLKSDQI